MTDQPAWEDFAEGVIRMKIDGGWLYQTAKGVAFVRKDHATETWRADKPSKLRDVLGEPE